MRLAPGGGRAEGRALHSRRRPWGGAGGRRAWRLRLVSHGPPSSSEPAGGASRRAGAGLLGPAPASHPLDPSPSPAGAKTIERRGGGGGGALEVAELPPEPESDRSTRLAMGLGRGEGGKVAVRTGEAADGRLWTPAAVATVGRRWVGGRGLSHRKLTLIYISHRKGC
jgi:hypothetical protein